ncbi:MAG: C40 family peptidase [Clostridia bacterium]|nr:C40 family peptidase [Clostridia bacterium]
MKRRIVSLALCLVLLCTAIPSVSAAGNFSGVADWFEPSLREMQELDLLPASFDGMNLSQNITRGEMCELAVYAFERITGYSIEPWSYAYFSDTQDEYVVKAFELGIVNGYPDGTFQPDVLLTRQEFFQIIENFCNAAAFRPYGTSSYLDSFADGGTVADWAAEAAQICVQYGYVNGKANDDGTYLDPTGNTSRQEAMAMFLRAYKSLNEYYYYILNATVVVDDSTQEPSNDVDTNISTTDVSKQMKVTSAGLNIRSKASTNGTILGTVKKGTVLTVTGLCTNGWVRVDYQGMVGFVSGDYVVDADANMPDEPYENETPPEQEEPDNNTDIYVPAGSGAVDIANFAMEFVGYPYVYGAESPSQGFDCSGLVYYCFGEFGISLKRTADDQMNHNGTSVSKSDLQVGDLVFFGYGGYADHVGIYIGNNNFVHAANPSSGVRVSSMDETYYLNKYIGARRISVN